MHGPLGVLRPADSGSRRHPPSPRGRRPGCDALRHRRELRGRPQRDPGRQGAGRPQGEPGHRDQVRPPARRRWHPPGHRRLARERPACLEREPGAPRHGPHRPVLPPSRRSRHAHRRDGRRHGAAGGGRQGAGTGALGGVRRDIAARTRRPPDHGAPDRVLALQPGDRGGDPPHVRRARRLARRLFPARTGSAHRELLGGLAAHGRRLPACGAAPVRGRQPRGQPGARRGREGGGPAPRRDARADRARLGAGSRRACGGDPRHHEALSPGGEPGGAAGGADRRGPRGARPAGASACGARATTRPGWLPSGADSVAPRPGRGRGS